jgi:hypothetical protein
MKSKAFLVPVLIFFGGCAAALAVSPLQRIPYEKQTDLPAGTYTMRFSLWNVSSGGTAAANMVWSETRIMTFNTANPKVSTRLGAYGSPLEEAVFQEQLWVQVDYQVHAGDPWNPIGNRNLLTMVPYAMSSIMAESGGSVRSVTAGPGLTGSGVTGDVTLGLRNGGVTAANLAEAAVTSAKIADATITSLDIAGGAVTDDKITGPIAGSKLGAHGHSGSDVTSGTISTARLNVGLAAGTVAAGNHAHNYDARYVNEGQANSITGEMISSPLNLEGIAYNGIIVAKNTGDSGRALYGVATGPSSHAVRGYASRWGDAENIGGSFAANGNGGRGVYGEAGAYGRDVINYGGHFKAAGGRGRGVLGVATGQAGYGVRGEASGDFGVGVYGHATSEDPEKAHYGGVFVAEGYRGTAVKAISNGIQGTAVMAHAMAIGVGYAGKFDGDVDVSGTLTKSGGAFKIDHPLDPENKYLYHSFVESPDMMNIYNGNVILDEVGEAWVELPDWFEALNRDFRYQLTCIGGYASVYVAEEISANRFKIGGGIPGLKISWHVTGIRKDPYAESHRVSVVQDKPDGEKGFYLHPEAYGKPREMGVGMIRNAELEAER